MNNRLDRYAAEVRDSHPAPGTDPLDHLRHTLSFYEDTPDGKVVLSATSGFYDAGDCLPDSLQTGLTHGDLRALLERLGG